MSVCRTALATRGLLIRTQNAKLNSTCSPNLSECPTFSNCALVVILSHLMTLSIIQTILVTVSDTVALCDNVTPGGHVTYGNIQYFIGLLLEILSMLLDDINEISTYALLQNLKGFWRFW